MFDFDAPVSWKVTAIPPQPEKLDQHKSKSDPYVSTFDTKEKADIYKAELKLKGWLATVTPVFLTPQKRGKLLEARQERAAPLKFNKDWCLA